MAAGTISTLASVARGSSARGRQPYFVEQSIDLAAAVTAKGGALEAGEIIQAITVPANTMIMTAGFEITTVEGGNSADALMSLGVTGGDVDRFVGGFEIDAADAPAGTYATMADGSAPVIIGGTADTIDLELDSITTAPSDGVLRVFAILMNVDGLGDMSANEVDRDTLA